jgi:hypothetical protein
LLRGANIHRSKKRRLQDFVLPFELGNPSF